MTAVLAGEAPSPQLIQDAFEAPHDLWGRALALEGCAVQFDRALRLSGLQAAAPLRLRHLLRDATACAVRRALTVPSQIAELAEAARETGVRVMVLKGAALLLRGRTPGARSMSDIDVIASPGDARQLHSTLRARLGYDALSASPEHHLPTLTRPGALPVEIHIQLGPRGSSLDARIWLDAENVTAADLVVPSPTSALLHALEHGALVHWATRYRLRDLLDVADAWEPGIDGNEVAGYLRHHPQLRALATMLGGARRFAPAIPIGRRSAWRTVRRVARVRHLFAAHVRDAARATSLCIAAGVLAEGSPRALLRPAELALFGVKQARVAPMA
jgi:hypothetical protein